MAHNPTPTGPGAHSDQCQLSDRRNSGRIGRTPGTPELITGAVGLAASGPAGRPDRHAFGELDELLGAVAEANGVGPRDDHRVLGGGRGDGPADQRQLFQGDVARPALDEGGVAGTAGYQEPDALDIGRHVRNTRRQPGVLDHVADDLGARPDGEHDQVVPEDSIIASMLHADDPLSSELILGNVKVIIGSGLNEPRGTRSASLRTRC